MSSNIQAIIDNDEAIPTGLTDDETKARILKYIATPPRNSRVMRITPPIAAWILDTYNHNNRSLKPVAISKFARHMSAHTWALTGDCLKFSVNALLRDGQNRLRACVRSGVPFTTHVVFGVNDNVFDRMDQGKQRSSGDVLTIAGFTNANVLAGAARWVNNLTSGNPVTRAGIEPDEALRLLRDEYPTLPDHVPAARAIYQTTRQPMTLVVALLYLFDGRNAAKAEEFATAWAGGKHAGKYGAIGRMESKIAQIRADAMGRVHDHVRCALIIMAWNLFLAGKGGTAKAMVWAPGDDFPGIDE